jgi:serine/threonine protein phosphatase PrpC
MEKSHRLSSWNVIGASVQGPYHKNKGQLNQDAIGWSQKKPGQLPVILSVADGLGDEMFFRSGKGSQFAVDASIEICNRHIRKIHGWREGALRDLLLNEIIECWNQKIFEDLKSNPFSPEEELLSTKYVQHLLSKIPEGKGIDQSIFIRSYPYSTTLNTVIVTREAIIVLQVGDGDIVIVREDGSTKEVFSLKMDCGRVIPLSYPNVRDSCNVCRRYMVRARPLIIYLSSDGYSAGYDSSKVDFDEVIAFEFHSKIQEFSTADIQNAMPGLLEELSQGSLDDLTLGIIVGPQEKIIKTQLKLKKLCDQSEGVKEPGCIEPVMESTQVAPDENISKPEEKCQSSEYITGTERVQ